VHRVEVQHRQFGFTIQEHDRFEERIDEPLRLGPDGRVLGFGPADGLDLAVASHDPAVGGDLVHARLTGGDVRAGLAGAQGRLHRRGHAVPRRLGPVARHDEVGEAGLVEQVLRIAVGPGRAVGVGALDGHPVRFRARRGGQRLAPAQVLPVAEFSPVQRAEHDRFFGACQHEAPRGQAVGDGHGRRIPARAERMPDGRGDVGFKGAEGCHDASFHGVKIRPTNRISASDRGKLIVMMAG
jgi:hypothetical protein